MRMMLATDLLADKPYPEGCD